MQSKINKLIALIVVVLYALSIAGCGGSTEPSATVPENGEDFPGAVPSLITVATYEVDAAGYVATSAMGEHLRKEEGVTIRLIPQGTDLGRLAPVRGGTVDYAHSGGGLYWTTLGLFESADPSWGPQPLRLVAFAIAKAGGAFLTSDPENIKKIEDVKGKRIGAVVGGFGINQATEAMLATGDLTWDDLVVIEYPSYSDMHRGFLAGELDVTYVNTMTPTVREIEASRIGIHYVELPPPDDEEAWARCSAVAPYFFGMYLTLGAGLSEENPISGLGMPYPIFVTYPQQDKSKAYHMARLVYENVEGYKDLHPTLESYALDPEKLTCTGFPWHEGAIEYFKEKGVWTEELEAYNQAALKQQEDLALLWEEALDKASAEKISSKDFPEFWTEKVNQYLEQQK